MVSEEDLERFLEEARSEGIQKVVAGAFILKDGALLILKRSVEEDFLAGLDELPSGHVDPGETLAQGLCREVLEETALVVDQINAYVNSFDYVSSSGQKTRQLNFLVSVKAGDIQPNPAEHSDYMWVEPGSGAFEKLNMSPETRNSIEEFATISL